jgi:hypothetical protein
MDDKKTVKMQVSVDAALYERFKIIGVNRGQTIPEMVENLMEDFVEEAEEKWLESLLAKQLEKARKGEKVTDIANLRELYQEMEKKNKK